MKKFFVFTLYTFLLAASSSLFAQTNLSLKQCIDTAIANNLEVRQGELQVQSSEVNWKQARLDMLPNLNGSASHAINQGRSIDPFTNGYINQSYSSANYNLSSGVVLFNGLAMQNTAKQNAFNYQASKMDWQQLKDNLTINVILAYLAVLNAEDRLAQSHNQVDLTKKQVDRLDILNKQGAIIPSQLSDLQGQYAADQLNVISLESELQSAKLNLCQLMNILYDKNMELEKINAETFATKYEGSPGKVYQTALQQFSLIKAVDLHERSAEKAVLAAKGRLFPTLSLNGGLNTNYSSVAYQSIFLNTSDLTSTDYVTVNNVQYPVIRKINNYNSEKISYSKQLNNNRSSFINLNLRIPIFNSFRQRNQIKLAEIELKNREVIAKTAKTQLQQNIEQAYINLTTASNTYKVLLDQVTAYKESFRAAEIRFNAGAGTSIDYLIAKNNFDKSNLSLINAKYDLVLRIKVLDYYEGKPLW
jgi:outer membrane protein